MAFIGILLQEIKNKASEKLRSKKIVDSFADLQYKELIKLLKTAAQTKIGTDYSFSNILNEDNVYESFKNTLPVFDYQTIYEKYWKYSLQDIPNISWPGKIKYFALTSGTSDASSKRVPVTIDMIKAIKKTSVNQSLTLTQLKLPPKFYDKSAMMLGGSTSLKKVNEHYEGDLSGILIKLLPLWMQLLYKPGRDIAKITDWNKKLDEITRKANQWDVGIITGVPSWYQLLFDRMLDYYQVESIHDIWPNLKIFLHGGVSFKPYEKSFKKYFREEVYYLETYLASEGFFAYQGANDSNLKLSLNNGIFFEFVEFNENNFDENGNIKSNVQAICVNDVKPGIDYALLVTTCSGTWRYLIGDTIKFIDTEKCFIEITGRVKMFLSVCGEHLSIENMNEAVQQTADELNIAINEFAVYAKNKGPFFEHHWFLGIKDYVGKIDEDKIRDILDKHLSTLNDDYATERKAALKYMKVTVLPVETFYDWMNSIGKLGNQNKFPRVLKGERLNNWLSFLQKRELLKHD
tara:strand:+ start:2829 stop:4385 length:1557 start_codon:yes stop_codon:yes gene_type:complete